MKHEYIMCKPLDYMPNATARIFISASGILTLMSYRSQVCYFDVTGGRILCTDLRTQTTRRHVSAFMREIGGNYDLAKKSFVSGCAVDINTGEIVQ